MTKIRRLILTLTFAALLHGCGYSLAVKNSIIPRGQAVDVRMFANRTYQPNIEAQLRKAFVDELVARGEKVGGELSDLVVTGEIASLETAATAFSADDEAKIYAITIEVQAQLTDRRSGKVLWKGAETVRQEYPSNPDLSLQRNAQGSAVSAACIRAARLLVIKMNQSF